MRERLVVAGDAELGDRYLAEIVNDAPLGHDPTPDPIVRIVGILRYPNQRAIMHPDRASEVAPLRNGLVCRLRVLRDAGAADVPAPDMVTAILAAMDRARTEEERQILQRHLQGDIRGKRAVVVFTAPDLDFLRLHCAGEKR